MGIYLTEFSSSFSMYLQRDLIYHDCLTSMRMIIVGFKIKLLYLVGFIQGCEIVNFFPLIVLYIWIE